MKASSGVVDCTRYVLVLCDIFFLIVGIVLLLLAIWTVNIPGTKQIIDIAAKDLTHTQVDRICYIAIIGSSIICLMALTACLGTLNNNKFIIMLTAIVMVVVLLMEVVVGAFGIYYANEIHIEIHNEFRLTLSEYAGDDATDTISVAWRETQLAFQCCGINTADGYQNHTNVEVVTDNVTFVGSKWYRTVGKFDGREWPSSCCVRDRNRYTNITACYEKPGLTGLNKPGCLDEAEAFIQTHLVLITILCILLMVFEMVAVVLSCRMYHYANKIDFSVI